MYNTCTAAAKSLQSCPTLCDPMDCSLPGFSIHGLLQARTLEWVAISFSNAWKWKVKVKSLSPVWLLATPCTAAYQAPPPMGFSRQECWSGVPSPSPLEKVLKLFSCYCISFYLRRNLFSGNLGNFWANKSKKEKSSDLIFDSFYPPVISWFSY